MEIPIISCNVIVVVTFKVCQSNLFVQSKGWVIKLCATFTSQLARRGLADRTRTRMGDLSNQYLQPSLELGWNQVQGTAFREFRGNEKVT